jgi:hypothetical protein
MTSDWCVEFVGANSDAAQIGKAKDSCESRLKVKLKILTSAQRVGHPPDCAEFLIVWGRCGFPMFR